MSQLLNQSAFATLIGVSRSYITKLKTDGRLSMVGKLVDVEASRASIAETADPNRDDVASRWAASRGRETGVADAPAKAVPPAAGRAEEEEGDDTPVAPGTYASARARKEHAQADIAEMERDKQRGLLIERSAVEIAVEDVMTTVGQSLDQISHRVAPMLVGLDLDAIRAVIKQETHSIRSEMVKEFGKRVRQMAGEEEA